MTLQRKMALWAAGAAAAGLLAFAASIYAIMRLEGPGPAPDPDEVGETPAEEAAEQTLSAMLVAAPISLALSVGAAVWVSRRAFRPVREVTRAAAEITAADLGRRIDVAGADGELRDLATSFNALLARLERSLSELDGYAAHVSHEIRTPLAVVMTELEVALRHPRTAPEWESVAGLVLEEVRALAALADELLQLARSASGAGAPRTRFSLTAALARPRARALEQSAARSVALTWPAAGDEATVAGSAHLVASAVWNVVDNALRSTPEGGRIGVSVETAADAVSVIVDDSGPGVEPGRRDAVFESFVTEPPGGNAGDRVGVGLAIARRAVEAHGGRISVEGSPLGGARFTLTLPIG